MKKTRTIQTFDRSRNKTRNTTISELTDRLYYKPMRKELDIADIKKQGKLTEFVAFTSLTWFPHFFNVNFKKYQFKVIIKIY